MSDTTPENIDAALRTASNVGRFEPDAPPAQAEGPAEDTPPAAVDLSDDELDALLLDRTTRRETLARSEVRIRLAMRDPELRAEIERREERVRVAEEVAARRMEAAAGPRPMPLPGGGAMPTHDAGVSPDRVIRAAAAKARGHGTGDRNAAAMVEGDGTGSASFPVGR